MRANFPACEARGVAAVSCPNVLRLYLSASVINAPLNAALRDLLPSSRFELVLPQEFTPLDVGHPRLPRAIYDRCIEEMERCDAGILLLDAFGIDCAAEAGWFAARKKPFVGIARASTRFLQNWMVKGSLTGIVCLDPAVFAVVERDPILDVVPRRFCDDQGLAAALEALLR